MNRSQLNDLRTNLLQELASVAEAVRRDRIEAEDGEQTSVICDEADRANLSLDHTISNSLTEAHTQQLKSIEGALERIDGGRYGCCEQCEEEIDVKRLAAVPWASLCIRCQSLLEAARSFSYELRDFDSVEVRLEM